MTLHTERLLLDSVTTDDSEAVLEYCSDPELQGYVPVPVPYTAETAASYTGEFAPAAKWLWAIRAGAGERLMGVIELKPREPSSAELGFWQGRPHRGQGIMTEAVRAVVDFGLDPARGGLQHIEWCAVVGNDGSAAVARKAGFHYEGLRRSALVHRDRRIDGWYARLLHTDDRTPQPGWPLP